MTIRDIQPEDIDACAQVFMEAYNGLPWNYKWEHAGAVKYLKEYMASSGFRGFVICEDEKICGAMLGHRKTWWTNDQLMIDELFVPASSQGKGYGRLLLEHTETWSKEQGLEMIVLMTNKLMPAFNFYLNNDYNKVDQYLFMFKDL